MADEINDSGSPEIETLATSEHDDPEGFDFFDPDEYQDDEQVEATEGTDDETEADTPDEESEGEEAEEPEAEEKGAEPELLEASADVRVRLPDGTIRALGELAESPMLKADHTRKTQELAERRKAVSADASRAEKITTALIDKLAEFLPEAPDDALAYSDPARYNAMQAQHNAAVKRMQEIVAIKDEAEGVQKSISKEEQQARINTENQMLAEKFPETATADGRNKFFTGAAQAAMDLGFSEAELKGQVDHRIFAMAHYAKLGLEAEKAKQTAKTKLAKVAPTARPKPVKGDSKSRKNRDAMKRLVKSGSLDDALDVDFDY